ncbi:tRNA epoxyqueuosine(34) reductase QueG [Ancylobacter sp. TS-1]|uniref:tRNA epoxyqueuosine(34) reductase QueG n=1 Tax=Ancylobacter sp. TS-1 TaxID=1850374 RepID=UPI001265D351|nr:tRNA epoxyqueuosine(34) reductase QueG [Ancylobacter sp. TS-1]QFR34127.1 tRNA epoxyqueuosine(34) reductase QueG [Ancylobacter sp. TS-1]
MLRGSRFLTPEAAKALIFALAREEGFDAMGIARADAIPEAGPRLRQWIAEGAHGDMEWMPQTAERRAAPAHMWPEVASLLMLGLNYGPDEDPRAILAERTRGAISVYARGDDYHELIKGKLKRIASRFVPRAGGPGRVQIKVFVDTAPLMEKPLAAAAGLGWQGKHTNLVSRAKGSWLFLGAIATDLALPPDTPEVDHCGSCRACIEACPTDAFPAPYRIDARRCVSYLTIEHSGPIPRELRPLIGNRVYGCDDCLAACPWNKFAELGREARLAARDENRAPALADLARLDEAQFRARFARSPIKRSGRTRFLRNVLVAIGNSGDAGLAPEAERLLAHEAATVRGAAVWALTRLLPPESLTALAAAHAGEGDADVAEEWRLALADVSMPPETRA